jgi:ABC-2 type transport system permease protein
MTRLLRSSWVIARRDFTATVLSKAFIFFLLGPLFPLLLGGVFGGIGAHVASQAEKPVVAVIASPGDFERIDTARNRLAAAIDEDRIIDLVREDPQDDLAAQQKRLLARKRPPIAAVLTGGAANPQLIGAIGNDSRTAAQLRLILADARSREPAPPPLPTTKVRGSSASLTKGQALTGQIGQMLLFFLTILLSGMVMSQLIEEKSNKIIEVIAAAVPIDALFIGKLFAMLAASVLGIIVWVSAGALLIQMVKHGGVATLPPPAVGWPAFLTFAIIYFATNYLLLGALFLTIGAQASTVREVQTLSMPVTFGQVLVFGFAATAIGAPDSTGAILAAIFPFSSPMVMLARAAEEPELWPHLAAIGWQTLWVAIILRLGAKLFRRTVLKSGPRAKWWKLRSS